MNSDAITLSSILAIVREVRADVSALRSRLDDAKPSLKNWAELPERLLLEDAAPHANMQPVTLRKHIAKSRGRLGIKVRGKWVVFRDPFFEFLAEQGRIPKQYR